MGINLAPGPTRSVEEVSSIVAQQMSSIQNTEIVDALRSFLVPPRLEMRVWDWTKERLEFPTFVVAESQRYNYGIVFSDNGFGPDSPWGLVFSSARNFDADYCWYATLEEAFLESRLSEEFGESGNVA